MPAASWSLCVRIIRRCEVREIPTRELGLPAEALDRHPFPGPGLAIRCLCSEIEAPARPTAEGYIVPVHSVGVQGDSRSYAPVLCIESLDLTRATELINRISGINRVIASVRTTAPMAGLRVRIAELTPERLARLRHADAIVRRYSSRESGFDRKVWQFPVVLIPLGKRKPGRILRSCSGLHRFGGWHDRPVGGHAGRLAELHCERVTRRTGCQWRVLRSDEQTSRHYRVGVTPVS